MSIVEDIDRYRFVEPGPFQAGELEVTPDDIIANLPYGQGCAMWFDHHVSNEVKVNFRGSWWVAPSAARVIYEYYSNGELSEFDELVEITDRIDSAQLTRDDVLKPKDYVLVSMTIEGKRPEDEPYWLRLIDLLRKNDVKKLKADPEVEKHCMEYYETNEEYGQAISLYSDVESNVLVTDFRKVFHGQPGNRFLAYALFPEVDIWVKAMDHPNNPDLSHISVGHSIFKRTSPVNVGELLSRYGGGGHKGAGSCRPRKEESTAVLREIVDICKH